MDKTLPLANVKAHLSEIIDGVDSAHDRVTITRNGRAVAVMISPQDLESMEETIDLLSEPGAWEEIEAARKVHCRGALRDTGRHAGELIESSTLSTKRTRS